jgi:DNA repair exonuclease SbcCD nuclease subunit
MKVALLCDTHFGARNDSKVFLEHQAKFFTEIFFPELEKQGVTTILHLGDVFDRRKYINFYTLKRAREFFFDELRNRGIQMHVILGNHDTSYTTTNEVNSIGLLLKDYDNISLYETDPVELQFASTRVLMCPWIIKDTYESTMEMIAKSTAHILMGHFDLKGFEMMRGVVSDHGIDHKTLSHFESVFSGHYHHPSHHGNVRYLGAQYEMNWSDYGSWRGFFFLDCEKRDLTFVPNHNRIHHKLNYDDTDLTLEEINSLNLSGLKDCFVKVMVKNRTNPYLYDVFLSRLNECGAADVKSIEDRLNLSDITGDDGIMEEAKDTKEILHSYIDLVDTKVNKNRIKTVVDELYLEAISL